MLLPEFEARKLTDRVLALSQADSCIVSLSGREHGNIRFALNNVTLPFAMAIADHGWKKALHDDGHLRNGLNVAAGHVTYKAVADDLGYTYKSAEKAIQ